MDDIPLAPEQQAPYAAALAALRDAGIDFMVGGGFGLYLYLRRWRWTKDLDLFVRPTSLTAALACLEEVGFTCELTDPAWLAKARRDEVIDLIFCSYNGLFRVDDEWFAHSRDATLLGVPIKVVGPEEMIVSKCFVAARDRFDGSDIAWLIAMMGQELDWVWLERQMGEHWPVLLWQLIHAYYVFPAVKELIPRPLWVRLWARMSGEIARPLGDPRTCRGPMLDPVTYLAELEVRGITDPRPRVELVRPIALVPREPY